MLIPKLRFLEFTDEWQAKQLGRIFKIKSGKGFKASEYSKLAGIPLLQIENVKYGTVSWTNYVSMPIDYLAKYPDLILKEGDIVLALNRPVTNGQLKIAKLSAKDSPSILYQRVGKLVISENADSGFIYQLCLIYIKIHVNKQSLGSDQPFISSTSLYKETVYLPQQSEQQKIADFLTTVDKKIASIDKKVGLLKQYKKGVMQKIFTQQIRFKDQKGNDYLDWKNQKIGTVFDEVTDKVGETKAETYSITAGKGFVSQSSKFGRDISGNQNKNYTLLSEGEFSYNKGNSKTYTYGCVYVNKEGKQIAVPNVFISFKLKNEKMSADFFGQLFNNHYLDRYLRQIISSGARMDGLLNVSKPDFFDIKVPVPCDDEQQKIADLLSAIDDKIKAEETKLASAKKFKKALLQRMFV